MSNLNIRWYGLQLFADGGEGGGDGAAAADAATTGATAPDAGESRLRELGVPDSVLQKRAQRRAKMGGIARPAAQQADDEPGPEAKPAQQAASAEHNTPAEEAKASDVPARMSWEEIVKDPEYNKEIQTLVQSRLKSAKSAEETLSKLAPAIELLCRKHGLDAANYNADDLARAISEDDAYYEDRALELGVPIETAKQIDQNERETARRQAQEQNAIEQQRIQDHVAKLRRQEAELKKTFPNFDLMTELKNNDAFKRMTSPNVGISVADAYYACHRAEIEAASHKLVAERTAQQIANSVRSNASRPVENGVRAQAPSSTTINHAKATPDERAALRKRIYEAAARGEKIYPGQY